MTLLLHEQQVHTGMIVALTLAGKAEPELQEGHPLVLKSLLGGIPMRKKLYHVINGQLLLEQSSEGLRVKPLTNNPLNIDVTCGMEGFNDNIRFMPIYTFTPKDAPHNMEFVVYVDGQRLKYPSGRNVYVRSDADGTILSHNGYEYDFWQRKYELPENAILVPIGRIEVVQIPHSPAVVYAGPEVEWIGVITMLVHSANLRGIQVFDAHKDLPYSQRSGPYLHIGLEGLEIECQKFAEHIAKNIVLAKGSFNQHCPYCWRTITHEHSL